MKRLPRGVVTFLFTDLENSTRIHHRLGERFVELMQSHDAILRDAIDAHGGLVVETTGDGIFAVFTHASQAVAACHQAQVNLGRQAWPGAAQVRVRMGLHTSEAEPEEDRYVSLAVHEAARVADAAHGGQVLATDLTVAAASETAEFHALGVFQLKGFERPVRLFQLQGEGLTAAFPTVRAVPAAAHNVPMVLSSFVGRKEDLVDLERALEAHRIVSIVGPGGVGKTRLALELVRRCADAYDDGAWVVLLAPLSDPEQLPARVAHAVGATTRSHATVLDALVEHVGARELLILIDNCEHMLVAVATLVRELLVRCPGSTVLTTSREALRIAGERVIRLDPLPLPPETGTTDGITDAMRLFLDRAGISASTIEHEPTRAHAVARICRRCEGIPLALELAAARVPHMPLEQLDERLGNRLQLLRRGDRTAEARHQTLQAAIDWSHELLTQEEQVLFRRLAVFHNPFTLEAAEQVTADDLIRPQEVLDVLADLVDKSLVMVADSGSDLSYRMLAAIREYANARLVSSAEADRSLDRHADHFARIISGLPIRPQTTIETRAQEGPYVREQLDLIARQFDDLRAAFDHFVRKGEAEAALGFAARIGRYSFFTGARQTEACQWTQRALELQGGSLELRGWVLYGSVLLEAMSGPSPRLEPAALEALELGRRSGSWRLTAAAFHILGDAAFLHKDSKRARGFYEQAIAVNAGRPDATIHDYVLQRALAILATQDGDPARAEAELRGVLQAMRHSGDDFEVCRTLSELGYTLMVKRDRDAAREVFREELDLAVELGATREQAIAITGLGQIAYEEGRHQEADRCLAQARSLAALLGEPLEVVAVGDMGAWVYPPLAQFLSRGETNGSSD